MLLSGLCSIRFCDCAVLFLFHSSLVALLLFTSSPLLLFLFLFLFFSSSSPSPFFSSSSSLPLFLSLFFFPFSFFFFKKNRFGVRFHHVSVSDLVQSISCDLLFRSPQFVFLGLHTFQLQLCCTMTDKTATAVLAQGRLQVSSRHIMVAELDLSPKIVCGTRLEAEY